jgi:hypothetical protein
MKEGEMGRTHSTHGERWEMRTEFQSDSVEG